MSVATASQLRRRLADGFRSKGQGLLREYRHARSAGQRWMGEEVSGQSLRSLESSLKGVRLGLPSAIFALNAALAPTQNWSDYQARVRDPPNGGATTSRIRNQPQLRFLRSFRACRRRKEVRVVLQV